MANLLSTTVNGSLNVQGSSMYVTASQLHIGKASSGTAQMSFESWGSYTGAIAMNSSGAFHWGGQGNSEWYFKKNNTYNGDYSASGTTVLRIASDGNIWSAYYSDWLSNIFNSKQNASTAITTSNIGSQSVNYASSAGNADTVDGRHADYFYPASTDNGYSTGDIYGSGTHQRLWGTDSVQNLLAFRPPTSIEYSTDGVNWTATTATTGLWDNKMFGKWGGFNMAVGNNVGGWRYVRMTWVNFGYHFFSHFTLAHSTNGHSFNFVFQKSDLNGVFSGEAFRQNGISSWPGYTFTKHSNVSGWWDTRDIRFVFELNHNNDFPNNSISIGHIGLMGGYSGFTRLYDWDADRNMFFGGVIYAATGNSNNWNTAYGWGNHATAGYQAASTAINTSNIGSQSVNYASSAGSVAWTNVSSRPTALSQFTNDLGNYGGFLTSLGFSYSTGVSANHVVQRDGNGYIYANHINFNTPETENPAISSFITSNGDGWSRKSSLAHVRNQLGNYGNWITTDGRAYPRRSDGTNINFYWSGQGGQPTWLWGSNDGENFYVWNPSNFSVNYAATAGSADNIDGWGFRNTGSNDSVNADTIDSNGITYYSAGVSNFSGNATDGALYSQRYSSSWQHQIAGDYRSGQIALRGKNNGTWTGWRTVLDSSNYSNWAIARSGDTIDNIIYFRTNQGDYLGSLDSAKLQVYSDNNQSAFMSFHRGGYYAVNFGLDRDNVMRIGGWSASANRWELDMSGNNTVAGSFRAPIFYDSADTTYYLDPNAGTSLKIAGGIVSTAANGAVLLKHANSEANSWIFQENAANWGLFWFNAGGQSGQTIGSYTTVGAELFGMNNAVAGYNPNSAWSGTNADTRASWMLSNYSGYLWTQGTQYSETDMRAPIFYDSNNTGYYGNFASTSVMNAIRFGTSTNNATLYGNDDWGVRLNTDSGWIQFGPANSSWAHIYSNLPFYFNQDLYVNGTRVVLNSGTWGINITGNSNTTSQVVFSDLKGNFPSGAGGGYSFGSNHYSMGLDAGDGGWNHPHYRDLIIGYHTGIRIGANYSGIRFYDNSPTTDANNDGNGDGGEKLLMTIGGYVGTANHTDVVVNNNLFANVSMRAPIFYDSNDTAFYVDPNSASRVRNLYVGDSGSNWVDTGGWGTQLHVSNGPHSIIRVYARDEAIQTVLFSHNGGQSKVGSGTNHDFTIVRNFSDRMIFYSGYTYANGYLQAADSLRAPIFYDSNDTGYYLDPNSESNLWRFTAASMTRNAMNYLSINSPYVTRSQQAVGHLNGIMGWGNTDLNTVFSNWGSGFFDSWSWPGQRPNDSASHWVGLQSMHYNHQNGTNGYGWQMVNGGNTNRWYLRQGWPDVGSWQEIITSGNIGSQSVNYATSAGSSSSSSRSSALDIVGYGSGNMTYYQTSGTFAGYSGWAGYFVSNHGDGATYYNQTIIMPFWGPPQYSRLQGGTFVGPYTFWTTENLNDYAPNMNQYVRTSDNVTFNTTTAPTILVNNHSDNTKGYRIHNTSGSSVSAMFTNSSNQLVIAAGAVDQINLNKKVYVNGVALGVNVAPSATAGRIDASNDIVAYSSSDERLKYNITPIENAIDKVKSLTGVEFDWKPEYKHAHGYEGHDTGIIAQQVQEVIPSAVRTNDTGFLAVRYEKLIGLLVEGMKEQQAQIEELKAKLDGLTK